MTSATMDEIVVNMYHMHSSSSDKGAPFLSTPLGNAWLRIGRTLLTGGRLRFPQNSLKSKKKIESSGVPLPRHPYFEQSNFDTVQGAL